MSSVAIVPLSHTKINGIKVLLIRGQYQVQPKIIAAFNMPRWAACEEPRAISFVVVPVAKVVPSTSR